MTLQPCPYCAEPIEPGTDRCRHCGEHLNRPREEGGGDAYTGDDAAQHYDVGAIVGFVFKDPDWLRALLLGGLCLLFAGFLVPMWALMGMKLRVARQQRRRPGPARLPTWDGFGELMVDGLKLWVAMILPILLIMAVFMAVILAGVAVAAATGGKGPVGPLLVVGLIALYGVFFLTLFAYTYVQPAVEMEYLETGSMAAGLHFKALWGWIGGDPIEYLLVFIYHYLIMQILAPLGVLLCVIGMFATIPWGMYTDGVLFGRYLAKRDQERRGPRAKPSA